MVQEAWLEAAGAHFWKRLEPILGAVCKQFFVPILEQHLLKLASAREGRVRRACPTTPPGIMGEIHAKTIREKRYENTSTQVLFGEKYARPLPRYKIEPMTGKSIRMTT